MRLTLLSMPCAAGLAAVRSILGDGAHEVASLVLAGSPRPDDPLARLAEQHGVPVQWVGRATVAEAVRQDQPDLVAVACFPWLLRPDVLAIPRLGGVNLHPSLLPALRGPEPVFWAYRNGLRVTGVTVHLLDGAFDHGAVVAQAAVPIPAGSRGDDLEAQLMEIGAALLLEALPAFAAGRLVATPQDEARASWAPSPAPADWVVTSLLPAAWAWQFVRGVAHLGGPLVVQAGGRTIPVLDAVAFDPEERISIAVHEEADGDVTVRFAQGWVRFVPRREA